MKKQLLFLVLMLLPLVSSAHDIEVQNADGVTIYYNYTNDGKELAVTFRGSSYSSYSDEYIGNIVIPEFVNYNDVTYNVTSIGWYAFHSCYRLSSVTIPNSVTNIGDGVFYSCSSLTSFTIPNSVTNIGGSAFYGCSSLTSVTIPNSVTNIGGRAFSGCSSLTSVTIPNSVTNIGVSAFSGCSSLTSITIPNNVTSIYANTFLNCSSLASVTIGNNVTSIGTSAFSGCSDLGSIIVNAGNTKYDSRDECNAIIETASNTLMLGCKNTTIPNSVTSIGPSAFNGCTGLTSITIPNSVTSIDAGAFSGCSGLTSIIVNAGNTKYDSRDDCNAIIETASNTLIIGCKNTTIPSSVTIIGGIAFADCSGLTSITIPNNVTSIGSAAFQNCSSLTSVTIGNSVTSIGSIAFGSCSSLTSVTIGNNVTSIGTSAFYGCSSLTSITIPNSVTSIRDGAFKNCGLRNIVFQNVLTKFETGSFSQAIYNHAMLYVPSGKMWEAIYNGSWYLFINIREMAAETDELSDKNAYTLMNAKTFEYIAYDNVNNDLKTIDTYKNVDENIANNCWQIVKADGKHYLYNIGAKKYAAMQADGKLKLSEQATPLSMTNGNSGIIMGENDDNQWNFVLNENMSIDQSITGIVEVRSKMSDGRGIYYDLNGVRQPEPKKGVNIINGKKIVVK